MTTDAVSAPEPFWRKLFLTLAGAEEGNSRERALLRERVELLYRQGIAGVAVHTVVVAALTALFWDSVPLGELLWWSVAMLAFGWIRGGFIVAFNRRDPETRDPVAWGAIFAVMIALVGITWGLGGVFVVPENALDQVLFILLLGGTAAGTATTLASMRFIILIALTTSLLPFIGRLALDGSSEQLLMAGALVMFFMTMMATGRNAGDSITQALSLRLDNLDLVAALSRERQELELSNRAKTRFLAAASHDLRQPLHAMSLTVAAYRLRDADGGFAPLFDRIDRSVQAMERLVNSLLDISRLDAGIVEVKSAPVDVRDVFSSIASEVAGAARLANCRIETDDRPVVMATDRTLLESIVRNLLSNAVRYAPGSHIQLSVEALGDDRVAVAVSDDGPGIPSDLQERVFEEFFQVDGTSEEQGGLGLGLAIVRRLSALLGGDVHLKSTPGEGSSFTVTLPRGHVAGSAKADMAEAELDAAAGLLAGVRVALIEDDRDGQAAMLDLMDAWGCEAVAGRNAAEIAGLVAELDGEFEPQVVISDFQLGAGREGPAEITALRRSLGKGALPAIILTGDGSPERLRDLDAQGLEVLHKPVNPRVLAARLAEIIA